MNTAQEHPVERFWRLLQAFDGYPAGVAAPVPARVPGTAFFSASSGLWGQEPGGPLPEFPYGGVMFLANNLDNEQRYAERLAEGAKYGSADQGTPTWRELLPLLDRTGIEPTDCFFTNVWVGLKAGAGSNTGAMAVAPGSEFDRWCQEFLCEQVREMRPRAVVALGEHAPVFLARMTEDLGEWRRWRSYRDLDRRQAAVVEGVRLCGHTTSAVALLHPSYRPAHVSKRSFMGLSGDAAEVAMLVRATR